MKHRRRRGRLLWPLGTALLAVAAAAAIVAPRLATPPAPASPSPAATPSAVPSETDQATLLLVRAPAEGGPAESVTLLAGGPERDTGAVVFLPVSALVDIPGHGLDRLGWAHAYGGVPLVEAAVENSLGVAVDYTALVTASALAAFFDRVGGLPVDLPGRLVERAGDGTVTLRFASGTQMLDGERLAELWNFRGRDEEELSTLPRQQLVWQALLDEARQERVLRRLMTRGAPQLGSAAPASWLRRLFDDLAGARAADELVFTLLPVEPFGGEGEDGGRTYRVRTSEAARMVRDLLAPSAAEEHSALLRVEVLNGVGTPGVGQLVHERLGGREFRIARTDNARSFDFTETRILVYDEAHLPAARRLRSLLGVGSISHSRRAQSVVDLTVVIGADFLELHTEGEAS